LSKSCKNFRVTSPRFTFFGPTELLTDFLEQKNKIFDQIFILKNGFLHLFHQNLIFKKIFWLKVKVGEVDGIVVHSFGFSAKGSGFESRPKPSESMKLFSSWKNWFHRSGTKNSHFVKFLIFGPQWKMQLSENYFLPYFKSLWDKTVSSLREIFIKNCPTYSKSFPRITGDFFYVKGASTKLIF
jgi:hypothetical protein